MPADGAPVALRPRRSVVKDLLRDGLRLDRTQSDPVVAVRNTVGVVLPLAFGQLTGNLTLGLAATVGALQSAFADRPGPYRLRILRMLGVAFAAGITAGLAVLASRSDAASVALLFVLAFTAGVLLAGGPSATQVGVAGVAAAVVLGHLPHPPSASWHVAVLVFVGGAIQAALAAAAWPLGRHRPERNALAGLYRELAAAARVPAGTKAGPPASTTLTAVRSTLYGFGHDHGPSVEAYRVLLDEAERIRRELVVVIGFAERLAAEGDPIRAGLVRESVSSSASVLDDLAAGLQSGQPVDEAALEPARASVAHALAQLDDDSSEANALTRRATAARLRALAGQLRAAVQTSRAGASEGGAPAGRGSPIDTARDTFANLRASIAPDSAVLRHAIRIAALVAGSDLVVRLVGFGRGYWVPLTVLVVLRPDFGATLQRAVMRTAGTLVGLLATTALLHWVPGGGWWQIALIAVFAFGMRLAGPGNVGLSAIGLSGLVVVLLEINGVPAHESVVSRLLATLVGGALAVLAMLVLPGWERSFVRTRLAALLGAYRTYTLVLAQPQTERAEVQAARAASRLARTNAQASVDRARAEPVHSTEEIELGNTVLAHSHRFIHAMMAIDAVRVSVREAGSVPQLPAFLRAAADALGVLQAAVGSGNRPAGPRRALRPLQHELAATVERDPGRVGGIANAAIIIDATDRVANSLDTLLGALRGRSAPST
ncbi:MAG TPA: FUSC family protein [Jatrophihabitans sp.]|nr:FUSC family protein [Jatrophihabitans sp.]